MWMWIPCLGEAFSNCGAWPACPVVTTNVRGHRRLSAAERTLVVGRLRCLHAI
ncbi:hypothetical protein [Embleya sp. MST-111070]|uniref:hypothetical protein n=1 Tax=Embleya sp. MST-111070 TaxID=3398231 RepID=UPI003F73333C